jgi:protein tyrosine phosphatase (PTP) superfamily phosphohydrolase (DUF442 family)
VKTILSVTLLSGLLLLTPVSGHAASVEDISNYRQYSSVFASSGQPKIEEIPLLAKQGFGRVIYLAFTTNQTAIPGEDNLVVENGMEYVHVPVDFEKPTLKHFQLVAAVLQDDPTLKTLLHCQINLRASTFSFLYRTIFLQVPMAEAKADLDAIWVPDEVWYKFIVDTLAHYNMSADCPDCDWAERAFD